MARWNFHSVLQRIGAFMGSCDGSEDAAMMRAVGEVHAMRAELESLRKENAILATALARKTTGPDDAARAGSLLAQ